MATTPDSTLVNQLLIADLRRQLAECRAERDEALQRETATAEVLQVINSSPGDLTSVFDAMLDRAMRLCGADYGGLGTWRSGRFVWDNTRGLPPALAEYLRANDVSVGSPSGFARVACGAGYIHTLDLAASPHYLRGHPFTRAIADLGGARTTLTIPFAKDETVLGVLGFFRQEVKPFSDRQITLLQSFATQAVIAVENARLLTETREALEQQIAAAEVMQAINASPGNLVPVFEAMLDKAMRLCEASFGTLWVYDGARMQPMATRGSSPQYIEFLRQGLHRPSPVQQRLIAGENVIEVVDVAAGEGYRYGDPLTRALVDLGNIRSLVAVALRKDGAFLGAITIYREERRSFTDKEITLLQNFAQQAVIAMENAQLLTETREALERQTATAEVLQVINSCPGDLAPVFQAILQKAHVLCEASFGALMTYDGERFHPVAHQRTPAPFREFLEPGIRPGPIDPFGRMVEGAALSHIHDLTEVAAKYPEATLPRAAVDFGGIRTFLVVPLRKDNELLGVITAYRQEVRPFTDKQIALLQNFAAQAVIAMENARLLTETREALEQQTATAEVLQVINSSPGDLAPVFDAILEKAQTLCGAAFGALWTYDGEHFDAVALRRVPPRLAEFLWRRPVLTAPGSVHSQLLRGELVVQIDDVAAQPSIGPARRALVEDGGARTVIAVPLRNDDRILGAITAYRQEVRPFSDKQIALLQNFAAQAVIAMENVRLIGELRHARDAAENALSELKTAQASLIQAEKMASLGQLTAGIAHEIKNPLNFVNNFAGLSVELLDELKNVAEPGFAALDTDTRGDISETMDMLTGNLDKIAEHGRRADDIVQSMLLHSRGSSGERRKVDLNELVDEALNLAYHGARARDPDFNITLERDFAASLPPVELVPQDMMRVFINLIANGFYAANKRLSESDKAYFTPVLKVATRDLGDQIEVRVRDNGVGIPAEIRSKLFQPFFTTKPSGEGTGLGLSISYDIITQQHGGTIEVDSCERGFTEFTIRLPRMHRVTAEAAS